MTLTEQILAKHAGKQVVQPGETVWVDVDTLMTHDVCGPGTIAIFKEQFGQDARVWNRDKVVLIPDHYIFTKDPHANRNLETLRQFAQDQKITHFYDAHTECYKGVCHVALAEEGFTIPGQIMLGTDSHTCTAGAFGMFSTGIGNTDAAFVMGTGKLWLKVPSTIGIKLEGDCPKHVMAKDIILHIIGKIGVDGATYRSMEFFGPGISNMTMEERMTLCNMVIEAGAKNGIIMPDELTESYLKSAGMDDGDFVMPDESTGYTETITIDLSTVNASVAMPYSPENVTPVTAIENVELDCCYIGSCTGGKITDLIAAANLLKGEKVKTRTVLVPATRVVESGLDTTKLDGKSLRQIYTDAGVEIGPPSCGACLGGPYDTFGRLNGHEVCLSTTNRNFPGRMGSPDSQTYLASPMTVAASAIKGRITDPKSLLQ